jgi:hypothetical protein
MTALDLLTVVCAVVALALAVALTVLCCQVLAASRRLAAAADAFERDAIPAVAEFRGLVAAAAEDVEQLDQVVEVAGAIGARVDSATDLTYRALTTPVIKGVALASGTRRAARRLRGGTDDAAPGRPVAHRGRRGG